MDALSRIPHVRAHDVLYSEGVSLWQWGLSLAQVLRLAKKVRGHGLNILDSLLNDDRLGEGAIEPLIVDGHGRTVE